MAAIELTVDRIATEDDWMRDGACRGLTHLWPVRFSRKVTLAVRR